jgi:putative transposase
MAITKLSEYVDAIEGVTSRLGISAPKSLWFRGQANEHWDLTPSAYRNANMNYFEREISRDFRLLAGQFLDEKPANEIEWMFVMQHYGLETRLLDWSESFLTALYFAVEDYKNPANSVVWVMRPAMLNLAVLGEITITTLDNPILEDYTLGDTHIRARRIGAELPVALRPAKNSRRILAQKGGFTLHGRRRDPLNVIIDDLNASMTHEAQQVQRRADHRILKEQEAGLGTADLCRKHGISSATFYKWKAKYGGLEVSDARKLKALEDENAKLKKLLAEAMLDNAILKDVAAKKW